MLYEISPHSSGAVLPCLQGEPLRKGAEQIRTAVQHVTPFMQGSCR